MAETEPILNLKETALLIKKIAKEKENIILYGDADMDGATSALIMREIFRSLSAIYRKEEKLRIYFPNRSKDGYGLNKKALVDLKPYAPAWVVMVDCGIGNIKEVASANKLGFKSIIIDHHRVLEKLPKAEIIVDPHQPGEKHDFREFANAGLCLRLAEELIKDKKKIEELYTLTALANIADQVPDRGENEEITQRGLKNLKNIRNIGIKKMMELVEFKNSGKAEVVNKIVGSLNSSENIGSLNEIYLLLAATTQGEAKKWAESLLKGSKEKSEKKRLVVENVASRINAQKEKEVLIFEGDKSWRLIHLGSAASELMQRFGVPVFLYAIDKQYSTGSARLPKGFNGVEALSSCKELLGTYGGHPPACGFKFKNANAPKVKKKLVEFFKKHNYDNH
jgi:single-stranded-DNA-specific exonuclease